LPGAVWPCAWFAFACAAALLKRWPDRSDRSLASLVGCSHTTLNTIRDELLAVGQIGQPTKRTGRDDKQYVATKPTRTGSIVGKKPAPTNGNGRSKLAIDPEAIAHRGAELEAEGRRCVSSGVAPRCAPRAGNSRKQCEPHAEVAGNSEKRKLRTVHNLSSRALPDVVSGRAFGFNF